MLIIIINIWKHNEIDVCGISPDKTRYEYEFEYIRINWVITKLLAIFFPGMYRKQGEKWMKQFKEFAEKQ